MRRAREESDGVASVNAVEHIKLHFVSDPQAPAFTAKPLLLHQLFPDERISHCVDAEIVVRVDLGSLQSHLSGSTEPPRALDEVRRVMRPALPGAVEAWPPPANADMSPYGESLATYRGRHRMSPADSHFDVRLHQPAHASAAQRAHHARLQGLALMFIDAASPIDQEDDRWHVLTLWSLGEGGTRPVVAGFATCFLFTNPFAGDSLRLCQAMVLPPFQAHGHGAQLLHAAYALAARLGAVVLTVEDPCAGFTRLRDAVDLVRVCDTLGYHCEGSKLRSRLRHDAAEGARESSASHAAEGLAAPVGAASGEGSSKVAPGLGSTQLGPTPEVPDVPPPPLESSWSWSPPKALARTVAKALRLTPQQATRCVEMLAYATVARHWLAHCRAVLQAARAREAATDGCVDRTDRGPTPSSASPATDSGSPPAEWDEAFKAVRLAIKRRIHLELDLGKVPDADHVKEVLAKEWSLLEAEYAAAVLAARPLCRAVLE